MSVLLLYVDGNVNLYVNVILQTGYRHQSDFVTHRKQQNYANLAPVQAESHEHPKLIYIRKITVNFGFFYRPHYYNHSERMILGKGTRG